MSDRVCAVVVTFNRKKLLTPCLQSLLAQTRAIDQILIVDNASTDGTPELLQAEFPDLTVLRLDKNSGGAGGFHAGMRWGFDAGFDWVWVMDDDVEMKADALETLLRFQDVGDLIQLRKVQLGEPLIWEAIWDLTSCSAVAFKREVSFENGKPWTAISYANFEGAFIRRCVMERAGFPDPRYFIGGDDTMYGFIAALHARPIYVNHIGVIKNSSLTQPKTRLHYYLFLRNLFLNFEHLQKAGAPVRRRPFVLQTVRTGLTYIWEVLSVPEQRSWNNFKALTTGFVHGLRGEYGPPPWLR